MSDPSPSPDRRISLDMPAELESGVYANFVAIWHDAESFTLDFATTTRPPQPAEDPTTGDRYLNTPAKVVARVKIPPSQVFEIMKALERQLTAWETESGKRRTVEE